MSTSSGLTPFLILVPDKPGTLEKRFEVRQQHIAAHAGRKGVKVGGMTLSYDPDTDKVGKPNGSIIVVEASSKEEIMEVLKRDVYYHNGVWDLDKAQITPLMIAILNP